MKHKSKPDERNLPYGQNEWEDERNGRTVTVVHFRRPARPIIGGRKGVQERKEEITGKKRGLQRLGFNFGIGFNEYVSLNNELSEIERYTED